MVALKHRSIAVQTSISPRFTRSSADFGACCDGIRQRPRFWSARRGRATDRSLADYLRPDELQHAFNFRFLFCARGRGAASVRRSSKSRNSFGAGCVADLDPLESRLPAPHHALSRARRSPTARARRRGDDASRRCAARRSSTTAKKSGCATLRLRAASKRDPVGRDGCRTPMQWSDAQQRRILDDWQAVAAMRRLSGGQRRAADGRSALDALALPALMIRDRGARRRQLSKDGAPEDSWIPSRRTASCVRANYSRASRAIVARQFLLSTSDREIDVSAREDSSSAAILRERHDSDFRARVRASAAAREAIDRSRIE